MLIWLHAVGLGEVLSLRGLIAEMAKLTDAHFLVTSSTRAGAQAFADNAPPRTIHQFLPLDAPSFRRAFLDHWQPDLCVWAEQDIWPGFVVDVVRRNIPQCLIAARMNAKSYAKHARSKATFSFIYKQMQLVTAQDEATAAHLRNLGAEQVQITGSLKSSAPPLHCNEDELDGLTQSLNGRFVWAVAPAHAADIDLALAAHTHLLTTKPDALLIIAPRFPDRPVTCTLPYTTRSKREGPTGSVWLMDTFGELGLVYRLARAALIGGTYDDTEGHNPWEAVALKAAIIHGPRPANFATDYQVLDENGATCAVDVTELNAILGSDLTLNIEKVSNLQSEVSKRTHTLAVELIATVSNNA
jgi:3-deoxy-D-manno-octulosonic-acid transferase